MVASTESDAGHATTGMPRGPAWPPAFVDLGHAGRPRNRLPYALDGAAGPGIDHARLGQPWHPSGAGPLEISRSALIGRPATRTFDLIEGAEHYPAFLPWCAGAVILARDSAMVMARISVAYHGLRFDLTTRNPKRRPEWMGIRLEHGPFRRFEGEWHIAALAPDACK